jgi:class 3 adenylate cyclase/predicted ATPase
MTARGTADKIRIAQWLERRGLAQHARAFKEHKIGLDVLPQLGDDDLKELAIPLGDRKRLLKAIADLRTSLESADDAMTSAAARGPPTRRVDPERRQLTLLFCDLVAWTELSTRLDPEDLREVVYAYQACVAAVVERFEGHVAKYLGDGVLVYFGYPRAHEDDAERAVRAGLELIHAVAKLQVRPDVELAARVGIATGTAVVGDLIGEGASREAAVVGDVPNLAARLQALSTPNSVVISQATRRLVGGLFELADLSPLRLKGFAEPLAAWRVEGEGPAEGRFEALHGERLTPLVGRDEELALLLRCWRQARHGEGQVVLLAGEPGIGKSRLVREMRGRLSEEPYNRLLCQCSPHHTTSPLHPLIEQLERAAGFARTDPPAMRLDKLEALLVRGTERVDEVVPLIAALLGVPTGERYPALTLTPDVQKRRTLQALVDQVAALAAQQPVLALYKDVHWIDPSTLELLNLVIERIRRLPVLVLITFRPEFQPPWTGHAHVTRLTMRRLGQRQAADLVARVTGDKPLPGEIVEQIVARADGVPLFVEELTKAVLESGLLADAGDHFELSGPLPPLAIPTTLHDSLMARLDRLAAVKEVAQVGALIGREFSHELLAAVAPISANRLEDALKQLVSSGLVFRRGKPPEASYTFKHTLVQEAAYQSLLKSKRQQLHARIAQVLEQQFSEAPEAQLELLAHRCAQAGLAARAVEYWHKAGQQAIARSAMKEAVAHLTAGLDLLHGLPESQALELDLQLALGGALAAVQGHGMPRTAQAYGRAVSLSRACGRKDMLYPALDGLMTCHFSRADLADAARLGHDFLALTREDDNVAPQIVANMDLGIVLLSRGELHAATHHFQEAISLYDPAEHEALRLVYSYDPVVICQGYLAWALLALGYPDKAVERSAASIARAHGAQHPLSLGFAFARAAAVYELRRDVDRVRALATDLHTLAAEHGFGHYIGAAAFHRGWMLAQGGDTEAGLCLLHKGIAAFRERRDEDFFPYSLSVTAEASGGAGDLDLALKLIAEGLARVERNEEHWFEAELHRLKGEALLALSPERAAEAEACLHRGLAVARDQDARLWELRAAASLARLWRDQGKRAEARDLLAPVYGWFTEGFDTADLKDAKALLDELG